MENKDLFQSRDGNWVTTGGILSAIEKVISGNPDVIYIHTEMCLGTPNPRLRRKEILEYLYSVLINTGVPTICLPTFTFSFCNGTDFDVKNSRSQMGALNEYFRQKHEATRSIDPLMSVVMTGKDSSFVKSIGHNSCGKDSTFDLLRNNGNAQFLFIGARPFQCFTYTHYVEEMLNVPYRYNRQFTGKITHNEKTYTDSYNLFVRYKGVVPCSDDRFERYLLEKGFLRRASCGDGMIMAINEDTAYDQIAKKIYDDENYFLNNAYDKDSISKEFHANNMVAL